MAGALSGVIRREPQGWEQGQLGTSDGWTWQVWGALCPGELPSLPRPTASSGGSSRRAQQPPNAEATPPRRPQTNQHFFSPQGHIDTTATILSATPDGDSIRLLFSLPLAFFTPLIPKGYIALDGTSLTLTSLAIPAPGDAHYQAGYGTFGVMLIAHTQSRTVVAMKAVGESVNVEVDVVGKGVESIVRNVLEGGEGGAMEAMIERAVERVLAKKGLI